MKSVWIATAASAALLAAGVPPASAAVIKLHDIGGVTGSPAEADLHRAADFWGGMFGNDVTVDLDVGFDHLGANVLGETSTNVDVQPAALVESRILSHGATSLDTQLAGHLPALDGNSGLGMITPGYLDQANHLGIDTGYQLYDANGTANNLYLGLDTANAKALGFVYAPGTIDATITFSSDFPFDFNPANGIGPGKIDFLGAAIHEIGHALGFISGANDYDVLGAPGSPFLNQVCGAVLCKDYPVEDTWWGYTLDLFRYGDNPNGFAGGGPLLDWAPGSQAYFSVDGGASAFLGGLFSTGVFNGDGWQASHWKDNGGCGAELGIMDPAVCFGQETEVTALDLAAFDAIGWNPGVDVLADPNFVLTSGDIYRTSAAPEPAAWVGMILGFALLGVAARRRRALASASLAIAH